MGTFLWDSGENALTLTQHPFYPPARVVFQSRSPRPPAPRPVERSGIASPTEWGRPGLPAPALLLVGADLVQRTPDCCACHCAKWVRFVLELAVWSESKQAYRVSFAKYCSMDAASWVG